jgi:cystathionine beta-lyase
VLIQRPVYYPFFSAIENNGAEIVSSSLILDDGRYGMDFDDFEKKAADSATTLYILCSPHNPVGRVWTREELTRVGEICLKHRVLVVADEIHADLIYKGNHLHAFCRHQRGVGPQCGGLHGTQQNLQPGWPAHLQHHHPQRRDWRRFQQTLNSCGMGKWANPFGVVACETAYREGEPWLEQVMAYIEDNLDYLQEFIETHIPGIRVIRPEGTYLVWLDCRDWGWTSGRSNA